MNSVVTLTDRPHITMDIKQQNSNNQKRHVSVDALCKSENNVVSTTTVLRRCFSGSWPTDGLPRKSEARCYTKRHVPREVTLVARANGQD